MRGSGKTTMSRRLIQITDPFFRGRVILFKNTPTNEYGNIPQRRLNFESLERILEKQTVAMENSECRPLLIIFDDCFGQLTSSRDKRKSGILNNLFYNSRHLLVSSIIISQYLNKLESCYRANINKLFFKYSLNGNVMNSFLKDRFSSDRVQKLYNMMVKHFKKNKFATFCFDCEIGNLTLVEF